MRGILIDPFEKTVNEMEWRESGDGSELRKIYSLLEVDDINGVRISDHDGMGYDNIWVDGEGLFKPDQKYFKYSDYPQPLAGRGLVLGVGPSGETVSTLIDLSWMKSRISWARPDLTFERLDTVHDVENHPVFGKMHVTRSTPIFRMKDGTLVKDWQE